MMGQLKTCSACVPVIKKLLRENGSFYLITCIAVLSLNVLYRSGDSSLLAWILAPTARWAGVLGGLSFEPLPGMGYVNETFRFLIAPSCSGVRFLQIVLLMLVFSHTHRILKGKRKLFWMPFCFGFSYFSTVLINGIRIVLSVYLPGMLEEAFAAPALTPERLHILIGTSVYFSFLLLLQPVAALLTDRLFRKAPVVNKSGGNPAVPVFWYFLAVLAIPFAKRLITGNLEGFGRYAVPIVLTCLVIEGCLVAVSFLRRRR